MSDGSALWLLLRHAGTWLRNLQRAGAARKQASREALEHVLLAVRGTAAYTRELQGTGEHDYRREAELAERWTALGLRLESLGMGALAKRCRVSGRHWAEPGRYDEEFLARADIKLDRMERLAMQLLKEIGP